MVCGDIYLKVCVYCCAGGVEPRHAGDAAVRRLRVRGVQQRARRAAPHLPTRQRLSHPHCTPSSTHSHTTLSVLCSKIKILVTNLAKCDLKMTLQVFLYYIILAQFYMYRGAPRGGSTRNLRLRL